MNKATGPIIKIIVFIVCLVLIVNGQRNIGYSGLMVMVLGLAGLLGLLWDYNRKYQ